MVTCRARSPEVEVEAAAGSVLCGYHNLLSTGWWRVGSIALQQSVDFTIKSARKDYNATLYTYGGGSSTSDRI